MKKIVIMSILLISSIGLIGCKDKSIGNSSGSKIKSQVTRSSTEVKNSKSSEVEDNNSVAPSTTIKTPETQNTDLSKARMALYTAGINSASISDEEIIKYWTESQEKKVDFIDYFKEVSGVNK